MKDLNSLFIFQLAAQTSIGLLRHSSSPRLHKLSKQEVSKQRQVLGSFFRKEEEEKKNKTTTGHANVFPNTLTERGGPLLCLPIQRSTEGGQFFDYFFFLVTLDEFSVLASSVQLRPRRPCPASQ